MLCDGSEILEGIWKGYRTPDLNKSKRFLRGGEMKDVLKTEESTIDLPTLSVNDKFLYPGGTCPGDSSIDGTKLSMSGVRNTNSYPHKSDWSTYSYHCNQGGHDNSNSCHDTIEMVTHEFSHCQRTSTVSDGSNGEIKPDNMNVVFIMKIK